MRKTRLVILPGVRSITQIGCLLLFLACPSIAFKGQEKRDIEPICKVHELKYWWLPFDTGEGENITKSQKWTGFQQCQNGEYIGTIKLPNIMDEDSKSKTIYLPHPSSASPIRSEVEQLCTNSEIQDNLTLNLPATKDSRKLCVFMGRKFFQNNSSHKILIHRYLKQTEIILNLEKNNQKERIFQKKTFKNNEYQHSIPLTRQVRIQARINGPSFSVNRIIQQSNTPTRQYNNPYQRNNFVNRKHVDSLEDNYMHLNKNTTWQALATNQHIRHVGERIGLQKHFVSKLNKIRQSNVQRRLIDERVSVSQNDENIRAQLKVKNLKVPFVGSQVITENQPERYLTDRRFIFSLQHRIRDHSMKRLHSDKRFEFGYRTRLQSQDIFTQNCNSRNLLMNYETLKMNKTQSRFNTETRQMRQFSEQNSFRNPELGPRFDKSTINTKKTNRRQIPEKQFITHIKQKNIARGQMNLEFNSNLRSIKEKSNNHMTPSGDYSRTDNDYIQGIQTIGVSFARRSNLSENYKLNEEKQIGNEFIVSQSESLNRNKPNRYISNFRYVNVKRALLGRSGLIHDHFQRDIQENSPQLIRSYYVETQLARHNDIRQWHSPSLNQLKRIISRDDTIIQMHKPTEQLENIKRKSRNEQRNKVSNIRQSHLERKNWLKDSRQGIQTLRHSIEHIRNTDTKSLSFQKRSQANRDRFEIEQKHKAEFHDEQDISGKRRSDISAESGVITESRLVTNRLQHYVNKKRDIPDRQLLVPRTLITMSSKNSGVQYRNGRNDHLELNRKRSAHHIKYREIYYRTPFLERFNRRLITNQKSLGKVNWIVIGEQTEIWNKEQRTSGGRQSIVSSEGRGIISDRRKMEYNIFRDNRERKETGKSQVLQIAIQQIVTTDPKIIRSFRTRWEDNKNDQLQQNTLKQSRIHDIRLKGVRERSVISYSFTTKEKLTLEDNKYKEGVHYRRNTHVEEQRLSDRRDSVIYIERKITTYERRTTVVSRFHGDILERRDSSNKQQLLQSTSQQRTTAEPKLSSRRERRETIQKHQTMLEIRSTPERTLQHNISDKKGSLVVVGRNLGRLSQTYNRYQHEVRERRVTIDEKQRDSIERRNTPINDKLSFNMVNYPKRRCILLDRGASEQSKLNGNSQNRQDLSNQHRLSESKRRLGGTSERSTIRPRRDYRDNSQVQQKVLEQRNLDLILRHNVNEERSNIPTNNKLRSSNRRFQKDNILRRDYRHRSFGFGKENLYSGEFPEIRNVNFDRRTTEHIRYQRDIQERGSFSDRQQLVQSTTKRLTFAEFRSLIIEKETSKQQMTTLEKRSSTKHTIYHKGDNKKSLIVIARISARRSHTNRFQHGVREPRDTVNKEQRDVLDRKNTAIKKQQPCNIRQSTFCSEQRRFIVSKRMPLVQRGLDRNRQERGDTTIRQRQSDANRRSVDLSERNDNRSQNKETENFQIHQKNSNVILRRNVNDVRSTIPSNNKFHTTNRSFQAYNILHGQNRSYRYNKENLYSDSRCLVKFPKIISVNYFDRRTTELVRFQRERKDSSDWQQLVDSVTKQFTSAGLKHSSRTEAQEPYQQHTTLEKSRSSVQTPQHKGENKRSILSVANNLRRQSQNDNIFQRDARKRRDKVDNEQHSVLEWRNTPIKEKRFSNIRQFTIYPKYRLIVSERMTIEQSRLHQNSQERGETSNQQRLSISQRKFGDSSQRTSIRSQGEDRENIHVQLNALDQRNSKRILQRTMNQERSTISSHIYRSTNRGFRTDTMLHRDVRERRYTFDNENYASDSRQSIEPSDRTRFSFHGSTEDSRFQGHIRERRGINDPKILHSIIRHLVISEFKAIIRKMNARKNNILQQNVFEQRNLAFVHRRKLDSSVNKINRSERQFTTDKIYQRNIMEQRDTFDKFQRKINKKPVISFEREVLLSERDISLKRNNYDKQKTRYTSDRQQHVLSITQSIRPVRKLTHIMAGARKNNQMQQDRLQQRNSPESISRIENEKRSKSFSDHKIEASIRKLQPEFRLIRNDQEQRDTSDKGIHRASRSPLSVSVLRITSTSLEKRASRHRNLQRDTTQQRDASDKQLVPSKRRSVLTSRMNVLVFEKRDTENDQIIKEQSNSFDKLKPIKIEERSIDLFRYNLNTRTRQSQTNNRYERDSRKNEGISEIRQPMFDGIRSITSFDSRNSNSERRNLIHLRVQRDVRDQTNTFRRQKLPHFTAGRLLSFERISIHSERRVPLNENGEGKERLYNKLKRMKTEGRKIIRDSPDHDTILLATLLSFGNNDQQEIHSTISNKQQTLFRRTQQVVSSEQAVSVPERRNIMHERLQGYERDRRSDTITVRQPVYQAIKNSRSQVRIQAKVNIYALRKSYLKNNILEKHLLERKNRQELTRQSMERNVRSSLEENIRKISDSNIANQNLRTVIINYESNLRLGNPELQYFWNINHKKENQVLNNGKTYLKSNTIQNYDKFKIHAKNNELFFSSWIEKIISTINAAVIRGSATKYLDVQNSVVSGFMYMVKQVTDVFQNYQQLTKDLPYWKEKDDDFGRLPYETLLLGSVFCSYVITSSNPKQRVHRNVASIF